MALIHPVEPLKYPVLLPFGDSNAGILHGYNHLVLLFRHPDGHSAPVFVVLNGIVTEIIDHLMENPPHPLDRLAPPFHVQGNSPLRGHRGELLEDLLGQVIQVHPFRRQFL